MNFAISGATGLIGRALVQQLGRAGHQAIPLVRPGATRPEGAVVRWDPARGAIDAAALEGMDGVVHLAGEPILGRWTAAKRARIRDSRVGGTALLARTLAGLARPPRVLVCASGSNFYGSDRDALLTEASLPGSGFLATVCREWEAAADPAREAGIRVVHLRSGLVLSPHGGTLRVQLLPFRLGLGGPIGRGRRWWSWIAIDDMTAVCRFALETDTLSGPVNAATPHPVTNAEFTRTLAAILHRPAVIPVPPLALRIVFGREAAAEAMLSSTRLVPARLIAAGFRFRFPELEGALRHVLGRA
jgi:uncharacterized protein (TIGR01777 family)